MIRRKKYYNNWNCVGDEPISISLPLFNLFHRRMLAKAEEVINNLRSMKILEIGPGFGYFAKVVKRLGYEYVAVEMNERLALRLKNEGFSVSCQVVPPFPKDSEIRVIWLSHVIEHCATYLEARDFIKKAYLALRPGGYIVIISPDILSWKIEFWNTEWSHGFPTSLKNCTQILKDVGFSIVFQSYHTATIFQPILQFIVNSITHLIPYRLLDFLIKPATHHTLFYSFMTLFGWRQIYLIGKK